MNHFQWNITLAITCDRDIKAGIMYCLTWWMLRLHSAFAGPSVKQILSEDWSFRRSRWTLQLLFLPREVMFEVRTLICPNVASTELEGAAQPTVGARTDAAPSAVSEGGLHAWATIMEEHYQRDVAPLSQFSGWILDRVYYFHALLCCMSG